MPPAAEPPVLLEPLGFLHGAEALEAVAAGLARPLAGGFAAFTLCRHHPEGSILPVRDLPRTAGPALERLCAAPPLCGLPPGPLVMGILNVTPDSFSDGGRHARSEHAIEAGLRMVAEGAAILDIGGESTRPGAPEVSPDEELERILPVIDGLKNSGAHLSVDTRHAATMRAALRAGAHLINDVSALAHDPQAVPALAAETCPVVLMHMRGTPETMQGLTRYGDVAADVTRELGARVEAAVAGGIARARLIVDPGFGFAKTDAQNMELLRRLPLLAGLGCRVLLGVSRKGTLGRISGVARADGRLAGSLAAALAGLVLPGVILRVHDVAETVQAVRVAGAING